MHSSLAKLFCFCWSISSPAPHFYQTGKKLRQIKSILDVIDLGLSCHGSNHGFFAQFDVVCLHGQQMAAQGFNGGLTVSCLISLLWLSDVLFNEAKWGKQLKSHSEWEIPTLQHQRRYVWEDMWSIAGGPQSHAKKGSTLVWKTLVNTSATTCGFAC